MSLTPKNWSQFQHYKDRAPPWIKLHHGLIDDYEFACLPVASRALAPILWLLASEHEDGKIEATFAKIAFRLHMTEKEIIEAIKPLIDAGFFVDDSNMLAEPKHDAIPEKEKEEELETEEETEHRSVPSGTRPEIEKHFSEFWKAYPKRNGPQPRKPAFKVYSAAIRSGHSPDAILAGVRGYSRQLAETNRVGTEFVAQAVTWLRQGRWEDYTAGDSTVDDPPPDLTPDQLDDWKHGWRPGSPTTAELRGQNG